MIVEAVDVAAASDLDELEHLLANLRDVENQLVDVREEHAHLEERHAELKEQHGELTRKMRELIDRRAGIHPGLAKVDAQPAIRPDAPVAKRILDILESTPSQFYTAEMLAEKIGASKVETVRSTLSRLLKEERIAKVGRNGYHGLRRKVG